MANESPETPNNTCTWADNKTVTEMYVMSTDVIEGESVELLVLQVRPRRVHEVDGVEGVQGLLLGERVFPDGDVAVPQVELELAAVEAALQRLRDV